VRSGFSCSSTGKPRAADPADYCGYSINTTVKDKVKVRLWETDGEEDKVVLSN
jgi:pyrimidine operon attenuation protein/uracil phosphoribosyltransferase